MIAENAGQENERFGAVLEAVAAMMIVKAYGVFDEATNAPASGQSWDQFYASGIGIKTLVKYFGKQLGQREIEIALAAIKSSTTHRVLMRVVQKRVIAGGQADAHFGFILEAVSAIMMRVAYDELSGWGKPQPGNGTTIGQLLQGKGVGRDAFAAHRAIDGQISTEHIKVALGLIANCI